MLDINNKKPANKRNRQKSSFYFSSKNQKQWLKALLIIFPILGIISLSILIKLNTDARKQASVGGYSGYCFYGKEICPPEMELIQDGIENVCGSSCVSSGPAICCAKLKE